MKKFKMAVLASLLAITMIGCTMNLPVSATSNPVGSKVGVADGFAIVGVFTFFGDASIQNAAKNGGITKISTVDFKVTNYWVYQSYECIVTGE